MTIHIVSFNVPYPPDYGGIIDVFYKIKNLHKSSFQIIMHAFDYGRGQQEELKKYCKEVYYYRRRSNPVLYFGAKPFIVKSRQNKKLLHHLLQDDYCIIFEGIHTTALLNHPLLSKRKKIVRAHNIEHNYYQGLFKNEKNIFKKIFFKLESVRLKSYEKVLNFADQILTVSPDDTMYFKEKYGKAKLVSSFHSNTKIEILKGIGNFLLYHANLSVSENIEAALFLINIIKNTNYKLILAGKNPSKKIIHFASKYSNIWIEKNPDERKMFQLIKEAQIICLPTNQPTGLKLKLIDSLFNGRHILASDEMVKNLGIESVCHIANSENEWLEKINYLMNETIREDEILARKKLVLEKFSNQKNLQYLIEAIKNN